MNTHKQAHIFCKAKAGHQCFVLILCFHLALGEVPGPCRHSVTKDHLLKIKQLIENQLHNGCSVTYTFTERQSLSKICYVKAAFPQVLEILNTHFQYVRSSDNYRYVLALKNLVLHIYSQKCIPEINEEIEDNPVRFMKEYSTSLREALEKIKEVIQLYMELMTENNKPVDWNCEEEYAEDYPETTTTLTQTTGATECHCSCPALGSGASEQVSLRGASVWNDLPQPTFSPLPARLTKTPMGSVSSWGSQSAVHKFDSQGRPKAAASLSPSVSKKEKEEIHRDINSSTMSEFDESAGFEVQPVSTTSSSSTGPFDSSDETASSSMSTKRMQEKYVFVSSIGSESRRDTRVSSAFVQSSTHRGMSGSPDGQPMHHTSLGPNRVIIHPSKASMDLIPTQVPFLEAALGRTPNKPAESTAVMLAKRSVDPGAVGLQDDSWTAAQVPQSWIPESSPKGPGVSKPEEITVPEDTLGASHDLGMTPQAAKQLRSTTNTVILPTRMTSGALPNLPVRQSRDQLAPLGLLSPIPKQAPVSVRTTDEEVDSQGLRNSASPINSDTATEEPVRDSGKDFHSVTLGDSFISYKTAFIVASMSGGLLLIIALYCFREQKKLKALLHSSRSSESQRLTSHGNDIELQACRATQQSGMTSI